jgi:hypothetical protein
VRKVLFAVILVLVVVLPFGAMADKPEELCAGVQVMIYGKPMPLIPEQCVPCTMNFCGAVLDRCPALICGDSSPRMLTTGHVSPGSLRLL